MRASLAVVILAMLVTFPTQAQAPPGAAPALARIMDDPADDHDVRVAGQPVADSRWSGTDLRSLDVGEAGQDYVFVLGVKAIGVETTPADSTYYDIDFLAKSSPYRVRIIYSADTGTARATLQAPDPDFGSFYRTVAVLTVTMDAVAGTFTVNVPHAVVIDGEGANLMRGDSLSAFWAAAESAGSNVVGGYSLGNVEATDRMPDAAVAPTVWAVAHGSVQSGTVAVGSPAPVRISNGEATTMLFEVRIRNLADHQDVVVLSARGAPPSWVVTFPQEELRLAAGDEAEVPVLVTTPFVHDHGTFVNFTVHAQSRSDPLSHGAVDLGVRYTKVPQPAGHHDTLFLHGSGSPYINTFETDEIPADEGTESMSSSSCSAGSSSGNAMTELVPLIPGLDLGLDADLTRTGLARITMNTTAPVMASYSISGFFLAWYGQEQPRPCVTAPTETTFAVIERSAPLDIEARGQATVELPIHALPYGDYLQHRSDISMALILVVWEEGPAHAPICCLGLEAPSFVAGSTFQLPLNEYHDPVDEYFTTLSGVDLVSTAAQQRLINPGKTALFQLAVENLGAETASFDIEMTGTNLEWARILGDLSIRIGAGESRQLAVAVSPPASASDGELVDVTLHAVKSDDANVRSLIRLLAEVDTEADHPDDSAAAGELDKDLTSKKSPGVAFLWLALALVVIVMRRR